MTKLPEGIDLSIPNMEANLAYQMATLAILYIHDFERRLKPHKIFFHHRLRQKFNQLMYHCTQIRILDEDQFTADLWDGALGNDKDNPAVHWDDYHHDVSLFAMLNMLIADKCGNNEENVIKLVQFVQDMPGGLGKVTKEDIEQLKIR